MPALRTAIIGAGAVGLALGASLHRAGHPVHFVLDAGRENGRKRDVARHPLAREGLTRRGLFGDIDVPADAIELTGDVSQLAGRELDTLIVCTKSTARHAVARALASTWPRLAGSPAVVLCQNGWGNAEVFAERLPRECVFNARVITGFRRTAANAVEVTVHADAIHIGSLFGASARALAPLCAAIARGGIPCELTSHIDRDLWAKVLYNCLLNPLGALTRAPYGRLGENPHTRSVMARVAAEVFAVMDAAGFTTHWRDAEAYLQTFYADLLPPTAAHESSMLQDLRAGRATEIDVLCGAVCGLGETHGADTPTNRALTTLIRAAEARGAHAG